MTLPAAGDLASRIAALPAGQPLVRALTDLEGVHVVGGAVRDLLLGGSPTDLDLVVEGEIGPVTERLGGTVRGHDRFGTATVVLDGFSYDIARARRERYPHPGALPEVEPAALAEDLLRRDFTVNAMAIVVGGGERGELHSVPGAGDDLDARRLRVLHEASFTDDPTRLIRLVRYRARLGFEIETETRSLAQDAVAGGAIETVSGPRIGAELRLLAREPDPVAALASLGELGLDRAIHPEFGLREPGLARRAIELLPPSGRADLLVLAATARGVPADELQPLLDRLAFEAGERTAIVSAAAGADRLADELASARNASGIAGAVGARGPETVALAGALGPADAAREWLERLSAVRLEIDGSDLIAAGIAEGP
ncbi:MAG TPA: hypothetical protein VKU35_00700, partial [Candidatus Limnocylindria bacterium]|nr:hypothetical protein [Candidatus Limnocylindria bacterium]